MEKKHNRSVIQYLKQNFLLLFSTLGALCLFLLPSSLMILLEAAVFLVVLLGTWLADAPAEKRKLRPGALLLAGSFIVIGCRTFYKAWMASNVTTIITSILPIGAKPLLLGCCVLGSIAGSYALYCLAYWFEDRICDLLQVSPDSPIAANLKANWFFPISALAFFFLEPTVLEDIYYSNSVIAAVCIAAVVACRVPSLLAAVQNIKLGWGLLATLTATGICLFRQDSWIAAFPGSNIPALLLAVAGFLFAFVCVSALYRKLSNLLEGIFSDVKRWEAIVYCLLLLALLSFMAFSFLNTDIFYDTAQDYDLVYTSDSPILVRNNAYLYLNYYENDLRQPLFAVFAAPFVGISYLLSRTLSASSAVNAILLNIPQVALLVFANFLLSRTLNLTGIKRVGFLLLSCVSYPVLLFSLMMEQYIFAYFYLILFVYLICEKRKAEPFALWGAGGSLLTSVILLPLMSETHPVKNFHRWFRDMLDHGIAFVIFMIALGRLDVILTVATRILILNEFTGLQLSTMDKLFQYTSFPSSCFAAPMAGIAENLDGHISWQLIPVTGIQIAGVLIILLSLISAVLNRDKKSSLIAAAWIGFSFVLLFGLGWGTQENGLVLYTLYFGWAFLLLLYQLSEKLEALTKIKHLTFIVSIICAAVLAAVNLPAIGEILSFAIANYPL